MPATDATAKLRQRAFFALLYFSEGAPIGYVWWAMPTRLRAGGMAVEDVGALIGLLTLPWALKFLWAPAIDRWRGPKWGYRAWITVAQIAMGLALVPLAVMPVDRLIDWVAPLLLLHAFAAATQDVAIDALAIATVEHADRGRTTGWMQAGMLVGRALFGGLALAAEAWIGAQMVVAILIGCIWFTLLCVWTSTSAAAGRIQLSADHPHFWAPMIAMLRKRSTWVGLGIALTAGAGFEAVGGLMGPYLLDRGAQKEHIGWFLAVPVVACMIVGSVLGGWAADRQGHRKMVWAAVVLIGAWICVLAACDVLFGIRSTGLMAAAAPLYVCIGLLTAASYAMFMDLTDPEIGGTQFSAFMSATNLCEVWAIALAGGLAARAGYSAAFLSLAGLSLLALSMLPLLRSGVSPLRQATGELR